uniref:Rubis-subs-bind domain-containing protein n=1 Tax=Syphacia muris TaxID=451379 RepID=A0A158R5W1_9BILA
MVKLLDEATMPNRFIDSVNIIGALQSQLAPYRSSALFEEIKLCERLNGGDDPNDKALLKVLETDQKVITNASSKARRRTVLLKKRNNHFGFTLQTYFLQKQSEYFKISYIDYVHFDGPAANAGVRPVKSCEEMRMILVFENIKERIQLIARIIRLRKLLNDKIFQLNQLDVQEQAILHRSCVANASEAIDHTKLKNVVVENHSIPISNLDCVSETADKEIKTCFSGRLLEESSEVTRF